MRYGAVYIAHNPNDGDTIFKVGKTEKEVSFRMKELTSSTSNLGEYSAIAHFIVQDVDEAEKACHIRLKNYRVQKNREFFDLSLDRLLPMVQETLDPYIAQANIPKIDTDQTSKPKVTINPSDLLKSKKRDGQLKALKEQEAIEQTRKKILEWVDFLKEKAEFIKDDLSEESLLEWKINDSIEIDEATMEMDGEPYFSVTLFTLITGDPITIKMSGISGDIYGELDLSKAIGAPDISSSLGAGNLVSWKEKDDGRLASFYIKPAFDYDCTSEDYALLCPKLEVGIIHYSYHNSYHRRSSGDRMREEKTSKTFSAPEEAYEIFVKLLVANLGKQQSDIRTLSKSRQNKDGSKQIYDSGKVDYEALRS